MVSLRKLFAVALVASLAGCAGTSSTARLDGTHSRFHADADYMYAVESMARHKGVQVVWINPPTEEGKQYVRVK